MFKVMIVDDEALVRMGLKSMIKWEDTDCEIIGEASNGQQGLDLIHKLKPDIVFTDIKMPVMDGLQMMSKALEANVRAKFIILSGFDEFSLVKQAMKLGAVDYLLKVELEQDSLLHSIQHVKEKIQVGQKEIDKKDRLERHLRVNLSVMREEFFRKLIGKLMPVKKDIDENVANLQIELNENRLICAVIKVLDLKKLGKYNSEEDIKLFEFSVINIIEEIVNDVFKGYAFKGNSGDFVTVFSQVGDMDDETFSKNVKDMSERLIQMLKQYINISVSIGISNIHAGFAMLNKAYGEGCKAVEYTFFKGAEQVINFHEIDEIKPEMGSKYFLEHKDELLKAIELMDVTVVQDILDNIIRLFHEQKVSRQQAYDICCQVSYLIVGTIESGESILKEILGDDSILFEGINKLTTLPEIMDWMKQLKNGLCIYFTRSEGQQNNRIISKAKKYINEHYAEEMNLNEIAAVLNISPGYFSTIFRQVAGKTFTDYVAEVKISHARQLLKDTTYKVYEISDMLGYENAYYFSRIFKKVTGITPREYIMKMSGDVNRV